MSFIEIPIRGCVVVVCVLGHKMALARVKTPLFRKASLMFTFIMFYDRQSSSWIVEEHKMNGILGPGTLVFAHCFDSHAKLLKFLDQTHVVEHLMR
jgi:hypothetical protein